jgi:DNA modification methylase
MFSGLATSKAEFQKIKRRMVRGSTTNVYRDDECGRFIKNNSAIQSITAEITKRLEHDNATSGFEKLYTKLVWEYFGGMFLVFQEAERVLKQGGKFALLVSDSHAFKMVHIPTAEILAQVAADAGLSQKTIRLWQYKNTTSHEYRLQENILMLIK